MRIAHVNQDAGIRPGSEKGAWVHVDRLRAALAEVGAEVVALDEPNPAALGDALSAAATIEPFDLVYERYSLGGFSAAQWAREHGVPYALEVNAPLFDEVSKHRPEQLTRWNADRDRELFEQASRVFVVSPALRDYARVRGTTLDRIEVTPNGVDTERFRPRARTDELHSELVPPGHVVLGFHGRLRPWHHFENLVAVAQELLVDGYPVFVLTVGRGDFAASLGTALPAENYACVEWLPHEQVGRYVACFDVLPLNYVDESEAYFSPLKLFEAMAAGVVPIVPRIGELPNYVTHDETGLQYDAGDNSALKTSITRLIEDRALCTRLRDSAVQSAREHSWKRIAETVVRTGVGAR